jgi:hypothetical protein
LNIIIILDENERREHETIGIEITDVPILHVSRHIVPRRIEAGKNDKCNRSERTEK